MSNPIEEPSRHKRAVKDSYDRQVSSYDTLRFGSQGGAFFSAIEKEYATRFLVNGSVLHLGTATGRFANHLPKRGYQYVGIEISDAMATATKSRIKEEAVDADLVQGDGEHPPFRPRSFDNVLSVRSFHFLPQPAYFVQNSYHLLKPGGIIAVSFEMQVPFREAAHRLHLLQVPLPKRTFYSVKEVTLLLREKGFEIIWAGKVTTLPILAYWRMPTFFVPLFRKIHGRLPHYLGTVGLVIGRKPTNGQMDATMND